MQKISFDAEDFPPPSYYFGDGLDDDDPAISNKAKDVLSPLLQDHSRSDGSGPYHKSTDVAPVHQSSKAVGAGMKDSEKSGTLDKSGTYDPKDSMLYMFCVQRHIDRFFTSSACKLACKLGQ